MFHRRKLIPTTIVALLLLAILGVRVSQAGPPGPVELPDVLEARPDLPVRSIPVVSPLPSHPRGGPPGGGGCDKDVDLTGTIKGLQSVAALDTGICTNADIDTYVRDGKTYVVIAGGDDAAWTHIEVTDPANPVIVGQFEWRGNGKNTYTPDVKTFQQDANDYIVLALERRTLNAPGGVVIYQVNNPGNPIKQSQNTGDDWVDVHNIFVEDDTDGDGAFIYVTADNTQDLRVLRIADDLTDCGTEGKPACLTELGKYRRTVRGFGGSGFYDDIYVHDVTVEGGIVYASYWLAGLDIFPASLIKGDTIGDDNTSVVKIDPPDFASGNPFLTHHAYPSADGNLAALQDEIEVNFGAEVVQLWTTSSTFDKCFVAPCFVDGLAQGSDVPIIPAHNLEIRYDLDFDGDGTADPDRLFVGWYKAGMLAWDFDPDPKSPDDGFIRSGSSSRTAVQYHQAQTEADDEQYSGTWGVRMEKITVGGSTDLYLFQSDRNFGLIVDRVAVANTAPTADDKTEATNEDTPVAVTFTATDPEECELAFSIVDAPANGTLSAISDNACTVGSPNSDSATVTYTPNADFTGDDSFSYKANDGASDSNIATVSVTVNAMNDAPVADDQSVTTEKDTAITISLTGSDVDGCDSTPFSFQVTSGNGPSNGSLDASSGSMTCSSGNLAVDVTYTPSDGFTGGDSFTFKVNDGALDSNTAIVSITVIEPPTSNENDMYVWDIVFGSRTRGKGGAKHDERIAVTIRRDSDANLVAEDTDEAASSATVTVELRNLAGDLVASFTGITNDEGVFRTDFVKNLADDTYLGEVTILTHATFVWNQALDPTANDTDVDGDNLPDQEHAIPH